MKKLFAIVLFMCLLMTAVAIAERAEWTCPQCNATCKAVQNFCTTDGQPAPWVWTCNACGTERNTGDTCKECGKPQTNIPTVSVGDYVNFGHYPQTAAGDDNTPIEWLVLDVQDNKALLLSRYGLDCKPYDSTGKEVVTWETCDLRTWLNDTFINQAFTASEQSGILLTSVDNSKSQGYNEWNTKGGNDTRDKVFLLSYAKAIKYLGVTDNDNNIRSRVRPTAYARANGAWVSSEDTTADGQNAGIWWLRSPGSSRKRAAYVDSDGSRDDDYVDYSFGVRPALWVNLSALTQ